jgi:hypothetical protein
VRRCEISIGSDSGTPRAAPLHRVADAGHVLRQLVGNRHPVEIHVGPMPMSHARRSTIALSASSSGSVASAQSMKPPRQGASSKGGCGSTIPLKSIDHASRGSPSTHSRTSVSPVVRSRIGISASYTRASPPRAACVIAWHAVSNWCVQFAFGSVHAPAAVNRHDSGIPASLRSGPAASGHVAHGHRCDVFPHDSTFSPSWRSSTTK